MGDIGSKKASFTPPALQGGADQYHLSQALRVGDMVWVSGQVGFDPSAMVVPPSMSAQTRLAFQNLKSVLESAGATMADLVELTVYATDITELTDFGTIKDEFVPAPYPAVTAVQISQLVLPTLKIEMKAVAVVGSGAA